MNDKVLIETLLLYRPDYKKLGVLKQKFPNVPTMALTATATPRVRLDILRQLGMKNPKWFVTLSNNQNYFTSFFFPTQQVSQFLQPP